MAVVVALAAYWLIRPDASAGPPLTSIAVLPFDDMSPGGDQEENLSKARTAAERGVRCSDPAVGIRWAIEPSRMSARDRALPLLDQ